MASAISGGAWKWGKGSKLGKEAAPTNQFDSAWNARQRKASQSHAFSREPCTNAISRYAWALNAVASQTRPKCAGAHAHTFASDVTWRPDMAGASPAYDVFMDEGYYLKERNKTLTKFLPVYKESERGLYPNYPSVCSLE